MATNVIALASEESVDRAWRAFQEHACASLGDRTLLVDRAYMENWARLEAEFKHLFVLWERMR